jgi:hypothetical protein
MYYLIGILGKLIRTALHKLRQRKVTADFHRVDSQDRAGGIRS